MKYIVCGTALLALTALPALADGKTTTTRNGLEVTDRTDTKPRGPVTDKIVEMGEGELI